jgi:hypothetical protein
MHTGGNMGASGTVHFTVDTLIPNILDVSQSPLENNVHPEDEVKINATVIDPSGVKRVVLFYTINNVTHTRVNMTNLEGDIWNATIPAFPQGTNIKCVIRVEDNVNNVGSYLCYWRHYTVIPEFPSFPILLLFMIITLLAVIIYRRKQF